MKGLVIINAYPNGEKFIRQGERIAKELRLLGVEADLVKNGEIFAICQADGTISSNLADKYDFAVYLDKDKYLSEILEKKGVRLFNKHNAVRVCDDKAQTYIALESSGVKMPDTIFGGLCYRQDLPVNEKFADKIIEKLELNEGIGIN